MKKPQQKPDEAPVPVPVTVITGFLGSGKTTLLQHLLAHPDAVPTAVLVNEFGEIGLDHDLIRRGDDQLVELSNGCICCAMQEDLVTTLADRLILTKTDLADARDAAALANRLKQLNPGADRLTVIGGAVAPDALFDIGVYDPATAPQRVGDWLGDGVDAPDHHHTDAIQTCCVVRERPVAPAAFADFLRRLSAERGPDLLRVKGLVNVAGYPDRPAVIHGVQQAFHPPVWLDGWPSEDRRTRIVAITRGAAADWLAEALHAVDSAADQTVD